MTITANMNSAATGTVKFTDGATMLATVNVTAGVASYSTSTLSPGQHPLGISYSGDTTYVSASTSFNETDSTRATVEATRRRRPSR